MLHHGLYKYVTKQGGQPTSHDTAGSQTEAQFCVCRIAWAVLSQEIKRNQKAAHQTKLVSGLDYISDLYMYKNFSLGCFVFSPPSPNIYMKGFCGNRIPFRVP